MKKTIGLLILVTAHCQLAFSQQRISKGQLSLLNKNLSAHALLSEADADFKSNTLPAKWSNESGVILCQKTTFDFDKKGVSAGSRIGRNLFGLFMALPTLGTSMIWANTSNEAKILVEETERRKILLNDKFAVDLYSILYFRLSTEGDAFTARVIKQDGSVQKVDASEAVRVEDIRSVPVLFKSYTDNNFTSSYRPDYFKIAVSDLEEGDIIEYEFVNFNNKLYSNNPDYKEFDPVYYLCNRSLPVAKQVIEVVAEDDKYYMGYKSLKGAPEFTQTTTNGKRIYRWTDGDRERITDTRYLNEYMELPSIKFQMIYARNNSRKFIWMSDGADMKKDMSDKELSDKVKTFFFHPEKLITTGNYADGLKTGFDKTVSNIYKALKKKGITDMTDEEYIRKAYYTIRSQTLYNNWSDFAFARVFSGLLEQKKITHEIMVSASNTRTSLNKVAFTQELVWFIKYKNKYYCNPYEHLNPEELPASLNGNSAIRFDHADEKIAVTSEVLPVVDTLENVLTTSITATIDPANNNNLVINKTVEAKGIVKAAVIDEALALTPFMENDFKNYDGMGMWEGLDSKNEEKALTTFTQQKKDWKEEKPLMMKELAADEYSHAVDKYTNFKLLQDGRSFKKAALKYEEAFVLSDLKASAGDDQLIEIPALIGNQTKLKKEERTRILPVDVSYPRTLVWNIVFHVPAGYSVKGLESLNRSISNECGSFTSTASLTNNDLVIRVKKLYKLKTFTSQQWPLLLNVQDAAYNLSQSKIVLHKL